MDDKQQKLEAAAKIIKEHNLDDGKAMAVVDDKLGKPDFAKLMEDKISCVCGKQLPPASFPIVQTGIISAVYNACLACRKDVDELAHLTCLTCKATVGHLYPNKEPTGFEFKKHGFYHIGTCPQCNPKEKGKADVLEKVAFFKLNNIPMKSDPEYN